MNVNALKELISILSINVNTIIKNTDIISYNRTELMTKIHIDKDNYSVEKYFGEGKEGFSISFNDNNIKNQIIVFDSGGIIVVIDDDRKGYHIDNINDDDIDYLIGLFHITVDKLNSRLNKH